MNILFIILSISDADPFIVAVIQYVVLYDYY